MELTSKQRAQLRGLANGIDTILQVGKDGLNENLVKQADAALEARELIKGRVLDNNLEHDARTAADALALATRSEVVQVIGTKFVLYRTSHTKPREKRIELAVPGRKKPVKTAGDAASGIKKNGKPGAKKKLAAKLARAAERPTARPAGKFAPRAAGTAERPAGRTAAHPAGRTTARPAGGPAGRPGARPGARPAARPAGRPAKKPTR